MIDSQLRSRCIESLGYVRYLVEGQLALDECPQHGHYSATSGVCQQCSEQYECEWLFKTDPSVNLQQKPDNSLVNALEFAIHHISGLTVVAGHDNNKCNCESCIWLRNAEEVLVKTKE